MDFWVLYVDCYNLLKHVIQLKDYKARFVTFVHHIGWNKTIIILQMYSFDLF